MSILGTEESELILLQALEHMRRQTSWKLTAMKQDEKFADVDWKMLNKYLPDKLLEELDDENCTNVHRRLSSITSPFTPMSTPQSSCKSTSRNNELQLIPNSYRANSISNNLIKENSVLENTDVVMPLSNIIHSDTEHNKNIRNELVIRFLTAMSIDYERQWYLGMIRRSTLDILIQSVERAKQKNSFEVHWKLLVKHFRLTIFLRLLLRFNYFNFINQYTNQFMFDHIFRTIELIISKFTFEGKKCCKNMFLISKATISLLKKKFFASIIERKTARISKINLKFKINQLQTSI